MRLTKEERKACDMEPLEKLKEPNKEYWKAE